MNQELESFYMSKRIRGASWYFVLCLPLLIAWFLFWAWMERVGSGIGIPWLLYALGAFAHAFLWVYFAWGLFHRSRPVVLVSDREVEWGSAFYFTGKRTRIPMDAIRSVGWKSPKHLLLETRSRGPVEISLKEVEKDQREKVFEAVVRRIHGP